MSLICWSNQIRCLHRTDRRSRRSWERISLCCSPIVVPTDIPKYQTPPRVYSGPNVMDEFYNHVMTESEVINEILSRQIPLAPISSYDLRQHEAATKCANCDRAFTHQNYKVRHHCHVTGEYLYAACNNCNLQLKPKKCKGYFLPIVFHNLKNYDAHFIIKHFQKQYIRHKTMHNKTTYDDVRDIPLNGERFLQFQINNWKFLDSYQFLSASLEHLVALLLKCGKENFQHTIKYLGDNVHTFSKGVYPYSYMTDRSKFDEKNCLPWRIFITPSLTNHCRRTITNALATYGSFTTYIIFANITTTTSNPTCSYSQKYFEISEKTFTKTRNTFCGTWYLPIAEFTSPLLSCSAILAIRP